MWYKTLMEHRNRQEAEIFVSNNDGLGYISPSFHENKEEMASYDIVSSHSEVKKLTWQ